MRFIGMGTTVYVQNIYLDDIMPIRAYLDEIDGYFDSGVETVYMFKSFIQILSDTFCRHVLNLNNNMSFTVPWPAWPRQEPPSAQTRPCQCHHGWRQ